MKNTITINLNATYVEEKDGIRLFQKDMEEFTQNDYEQVLIVDAPTGSGKTTAFKKLNTNGPVMIVLPNRILQQQVFDEIKNSYSVSEINKDSIDKLSTISKERRLDALKEMLTGKDFIITNPVILLNIILNLYGHSLEYLPDEKGTMELSSFLLKQGLKVIVFDEFHVYDEDQIEMIIAINLLLSNNIKFIYSSATPPEGIKTFFTDNAPNIKLSEKKVRRILNGTGKPIQGPLIIHLINNTIVKDFIKENINIFEKDNWLVILDKIIDIDESYKNLLSGGIEKEDICLISGYHGKSNDFDKRIVLASNIIEQGINPPQKYDRILIDPGFSIRNIAQRIGRIGRGNMKTSEIYICLGAGRQIPFDEKFNNINTTDELFEILAIFFKNEFLRINPYSVGIFFGVMSYFNHIENIMSKFLGAYSSIKSGFDDFKSINSILRGDSNDDLANKFKQKRILQNVSRWWDIYLSSLARFLPSSIKSHGLDVVFDDKAPLYVEYDELWIRRNKIFTLQNGFYMLTGNLETANNDFNVSVKGLPFETNCFVVPYQKFRYDYKTLINEKFTDSLYDISNNLAMDDLKKFFNKLREVVKATASYNRLILCEEQRYESM